MGSTYTRQSSTEIVDGEVVQASDFNNEFEQLVSAFAVSTGHSHVLLAQISQSLLMAKQVTVF